VKHKKVIYTDSLVITVRCGW